MKYIVTCGNVEIKISEQELKQHKITQVSPGVYHIIHKNKNFIFKVITSSLEDKEIELKLAKRKKKIKIEDQIYQTIQSLGYNSKKSKRLDSLVAPMPGLVLEILVEEGAEVMKGDHLITLEAMKMENILKAPHDGRIKKINVIKADKVEKNQILLLFDEII